MARIIQCWACGKSADSPALMRGKALPQRTKANLVCHWSGLCRQCVDSAGPGDTADTGYQSCKECGKPLPGGESVSAVAARAIGYCWYCYQARFAPPARRVSLAPVRRRQGGKWVDIRLLMSWWPDNAHVRQGERKEVLESMRLLKEETDE
ncbi:MAG: hypothetical protein WC980_08665 [Candidatus Brocadiia bacterium]